MKVTKKYDKEILHHLSDKTHSSVKETAKNVLTKEKY